jgi:microcystin degradation protein MlrC
MTKIFVAGFHHETNTFAPSPADWDAFSCGAGYPAYSRGVPMLARMASTSTALGGFAQAAARCGWTLVPSVWAGAMPSNRVTTDAFERICAEIVADLRLGGFEAIFPDLHGAAVTECVDDAKGEYDGKQHREWQHHQDDERLGVHNDRSIEDWRIQRKAAVDPFEALLEQ